MGGVRSGSMYSAASQVHTYLLLPAVHGKCGTSRGEGVGAACAQL